MGGLLLSGGRAVSLAGWLALTAGPSGRRWSNTARLKPNKAVFIGADYDDDGSSSAETQLQSASRH